MSGTTQMIPAGSSMLPWFLRPMRVEKGGPRTGRLVTEFGSERQQRYPDGQCMMCGETAIEEHANLCATHHEYFREAIGARVDEIPPMAERFAELFVEPVREWEADMEDLTVGAQSRNSGARFEREMVKSLQDLWPGCTRNLDQYFKASGRDLNGTPGFCVQLKYGARPLWKQAVTEAAETAEDDEIALGITREKHHEAFAHIRLDDLIGILMAAARRAELLFDARATIEKLTEIATKVAPPECAGEEHLAKLFSDNLGMPDRIS